MKNDVKTIKSDDSEGIKEEKISSSVFFIEANSYEVLSLWKEFKDEIHWQEDSLGFWQKIGLIDDDEEKPVCLTFHFAKIYGSRICFYDVVSRYNDTEMVRAWLEKNYPVTWDNGTRIAITNAMNFGSAIKRCKYEN